MKYSLRNFALTFLISLVIFGAIAWVIVGSLKNMSEDILTGQVVNHDDSPSAFEDKDKSDKTGETEFKGDTFNFLAVGLDTMPLSEKQLQKFSQDYEIPYSSMEAVMLVRADKENKKFIFISLPTDFIINFKGENMPLGRLTQQLNINDPVQLSMLLGEITSLTGLQIDYYAFIDMNGFVETIDNLGGISYNVPVDMEYSDPEQNLEIKFKKNQKLTKGKDLIKMLRFVTYNNSAEEENPEYNLSKSKSESSRTALHMNFVNSVFKKMLTAENIVSIPIWIPDLFKSTITNFGLDIVKENVDLIFSYKDYTSVSLAYSEGYINTISQRYSDSEPNKDKIKSSVAKISSEIGKMI